MRYTFPQPDKLSGGTLLAELVEAFGKPEDLRVRYGQPSRFDVSVNSNGKLEVVVPDGTAKGDVSRIIAAHRGMTAVERAEMVRRFGPA